MTTPAGERYECCHEPVKGYPFCPEHGGDPEPTPAGEGRVEEVIRRFEDDPSSDNVFDATDIAILVSRLRAVEAERDRALKVSDLKGRIINRLPLCSDHRDKQPPDTCVICERDTAQAEARRLRKHLERISEARFIDPENYRIMARVALIPQEPTR